MTAMVFKYDYIIFLLILKSYETYSYDGRQLDFSILAPIS